MNDAKRCAHTKLEAGVPWGEWNCAECGNSGVRVRALSLHNPYPYLILDLPDEHWKNIENRVRSVMSEPGPLLIHAALKQSNTVHEAALTIARKVGVPEKLMPNFEQPAMSLVGAVYVSEILPKDSLLDRLHRWKFPGHVGYVLSARTKLPPREVRGGQGLFHVDLTPEEVACCRAANLLR